MSDNYYIYANIMKKKILFYFYNIFKIHAGKQLNEKKNFNNNSNNY